METPCLCPSEGHQYGGRKVTETSVTELLKRIKVLCEQTREANKRINFLFGLCLILFGFGNIVADFPV